MHAHFATYPALSAWLCRSLTGVSYSFTAHAHDIFVDRAHPRPQGARRPLCRSHLRVQPGHPDRFGGAPDSHACTRRSLRHRSVGVPLSGAAAPTGHGDRFARCAWPASRSTRAMPSCFEHSREGQAEPRARQSWTWWRGATHAPWRHAPRRLGLLGARLASWGPLRGRGVPCGWPRAGSVRPPEPGCSRRADGGHSRWP